MNYHKVISLPVVASPQLVTHLRPQIQPAAVRVRKLAVDVRRFASRCVAKRVGIASCAPGFKVASAAAQLANATASANEQPSAIRAMKAPMNCIRMVSAKLSGSGLNKRGIVLQTLCE